MLGKTLLKHLWGTTKPSTSVCEPVIRGVTKTRSSGYHAVLQINLTFIFHRLERTHCSLHVTQSSMNWCYRTGMVWRMNKLNQVSVRSCYDCQETVKKERSSSASSSVAVLQLRRFLLARGQQTGFMYSVSENSYINTKTLFVDMKCCQGL